MVQWKLEGQKRLYKSGKTPITSRVLNVHRDKLLALMNASNTERLEYSAGYVLKPNEEIESWIPQTASVKQGQKESVVGVLSRDSFREEVEKPDSKGAMTVHTHHNYPPRPSIPDTVNAVKAFGEGADAYAILGMVLRDIPPQPEEVKLDTMDKEVAIYSLEKGPEEPRMSLYKREQLWHKIQQVYEEKKEDIQSIEDDLQMTEHILEVLLNQELYNINSHYKRIGVPVNKSIV